MRVCPCDACPVWNAKALVCREEWVDRFSFRGDVCPPAQALMKTIKKGAPKVARGKIWISDDIVITERPLAVTIPNMDMPYEVPKPIQATLAPKPVAVTVVANDEQKAIDEPELAVDIVDMPVETKQKIKLKKAAKAAFVPAQAPVPDNGTVEELVWLKEQAVKAGYELINVVCSSCDGLIDTNEESPSFGQRVMGYSRGDGDRYIYPLWSLRPGIDDRLKPPFSRKLALRDEVGRMRCWTCGLRRKESWAQ